MEMSLSYKVPVNTDNSQPLSQSKTISAILQKIMERLKSIFHKAGLTYMPISSTGIWHKV